MPAPGQSTTTDAACARRGLSPAAKTALIAVGLAALGGVVLEVFVARNVPELTESALASAEARWDERGPASYDMDVEIRGAQPGTVHVEVRDGEAVAMQRNGFTPRQPRTWVYWTVPGRFEEIERELEMAADPEHEMQAAAGTRIELRCAFDPEYGYPTEFHRIIYGGGTEVYWRVTRFDPQ